MNHEDPKDYPNLTVTRKGKSITISSRLLDKQNAWGNLDRLKEIHLMRLSKIDEMEQVASAAPLETRAELLQILSKIITELDFKLQEAWGFDRNARMHRFWELPGCSCPQMDNEERLGTGFHIIDGLCPIHGT